MDSRTVRVKGKGQLFVQPDRIEISMNLEVVHPAYEEAMTRAGDLLESVRQALKPEGIGRHDIKTSHFDVSARYEVQHPERGGSEHFFVGYAVGNRLTVEIDQDGARLGRVLNALAGSQALPEVAIRYRLRDEVSAKNEVLKLAVLDAKAKAAVLADTAGVSLGDIESVVYDRGEISFGESTVLSMAAKGPGVGRTMVDLEPGELTVEDTVTVVWRIA